jgi:hypothetical protein
MVNAVGKIVATFFIAFTAISAWSTACFDDNSLQTLDLQPTQGVLLYVWSPRMVLSAQHAATAQRQAQLHGLRFVPLHDAGVPQAEVQAAGRRLLSLGLNAASSPSAGSANSTGSSHGATVAKPVQISSYSRSANALADSQPLCAANLLVRDALRHFPTAFVVQASGVHRYPIIGAMPEAAWASSIAQRLNPTVALSPVPRASSLVAPRPDPLANPSTKALAFERRVRSEALQ